MFFSFPFDNLSKPFFWCRNLPTRLAFPCSRAAQLGNFCAHTFGSFGFITVATVPRTVAYFCWFKYIEKKCKKLIKKNRERKRSSEIKRQEAESLLLYPAILNLFEVLFSLVKLSNLVPLYFELLLVSLSCIVTFLFHSCFALFISTVCVSYGVIRSALGFVIWCS